MVIRVNRDDECPRRFTDVRKGQLGILDVKLRCHVTHVNRLRAAGAHLRPVLLKSKISENLDQALLFYCPREYSDVNLAHVLHDRVIEDDLEKPLA